MLLLCFGKGLQCKTSPQFRVEFRSRKTGRETNKHDQLEFQIQSVCVCVCLLQNEHFLATNPKYTLCLEFYTDEERDFKDYEPRQNFSFIPPLPAE
jgi:hypothetical protein